MTEEHRAGAASATASAPREEPDRDARPAGITRSRRHKVVGGVCGGMGRYFDLDPVVFRVPLAVMSIVGGVGLVAYGAAWLILPFEDEEENEGRRMLSGRVEGPGLTALLVVVVGLGLMLASLPNRSALFSVMLLGTLFGAASWSRHRRLVDGSADGGVPVGSDPAIARAAARAPAEVQAPPSPAASPWWREPAAGGPASGEYLWGPAGAWGGRTVDLSKPSDQESAAAEAGGGVHDAFRPPRPASPRDPDRPFWIGGFVLLGAVLVAAAVAALFFWHRESLSDVLVYSAASALAVFGLGLVISSFWGRLGGGTIVLVVLTSGALVASAAIPDNIPTHWTDERWAPASAAEVLPSYELGSGVARLDLTGVSLAEGEAVSTEVETGAGVIRVRVPHDVTVEVTAQVWLGVYHYDEQAQTQHGPQVEGAGYRSEWAGTYGPPPGTEATGRVRLALEMGIGQVVVERAAAPADDAAEPDTAEPDSAGADGSEGSGADGSESADGADGTDGAAAPPGRPSADEAGDPAAARPMAGPALGEPVQAATMVEVTR